MIKKEQIPSDLWDKIEKMQHAKGMSKYGHTLSDCPKERFNWFVMIIEEIVDTYEYIEKLRSCKDGIKIEKTEKGYTLSIYNKQVHTFKTKKEAKSFVNLFI